MKIIFKNRRFLCNLYKIFKIFKRTFSHKKYLQNVLTNKKICAKIGIVKVFFTQFENSFHFLASNLLKTSGK